jgi:hypothetical protein
MTKVEEALELIKKAKELYNSMNDDEKKEIDLFIDQNDNVNTK